MGICYHYSIFIEYLSVGVLLSLHEGTKKTSIVLLPLVLLHSTRPMAIMQKKIVFVQSGNKMQVSPFCYYYLENKMGHGPQSLLLHFFFAVSNIILE